MSEENKKSGYGNPPPHSKWKPGQSGNSRGRPKKSLNTYSLLNKVANEQVKIVQDGKNLVLSKKQIALIKAVNSAANGDLKSLQVLLPHLVIADAKAEQHEQKIRALSQDDAKIIDQFLETKGINNDLKN